MPGLIKIRLRGSNLVVEVIPLIAHARVAGGTAEYVDPPAWPELKPTTAAMAQPERALSREQNPPKRKNR